MNMPHFLRPEWLWGIIPLLLICLLTFYQLRHQQKQHNLVSPKLLPYLLVQQGDEDIRLWHILGLLCSGIALCIALAGPSFDKQPVPAYQNKAGLVIALDLSLSMTAGDVSPSRLERAKFKIRDILASGRDEAIGLVAWAGDAHAVSPLTQDYKTLQAMLPALDPYIMPAYGSNLVAMAEESVKLFAQANASPRRLLLITDGIENQDIEKTRDLLAREHIELSILAIGTEQGAPMIKPDGQFIKDSKGQIILPGLTLDALKNLQQASNARFSTLQNSDKDVHYLLPEAKNASAENKQKTAQSEWFDNGHWFALALLPAMLWMFRRGLIFVFCLIILLPHQSEALELWRNADQQGAALLPSDPAKAAHTFHDKRWQASAHYRAGEYAEAAAIWQKLEGADDFYNLGNSYARLQQYQEGIHAYDKALSLKPDWQEAKDNKALLEKLRDQQKQNQDSQHKNQDQQNQQQQNADGKQNSQNQQQQNADGQQGQANPQQQNADGKENQQNQQNPQQQNGDTNKQGQQQNQQNSQSDSAQQQEKKADTDKSPDNKLQQLNKDQQADNNKPNAQPQAQSQQTPQQREQQQALDQWLQRVPDDPSGLLRRKFIYQYQSRQHEQQQDRNPW